MVTRYLLSLYLDYDFFDLPGGRYDVENISEIDLQRVGACLFVVDGLVSYLYWVS